jgi:hypothetical protein
MTAENTSNEPNICYVDCIVCFIDLLGFQNIVNIKTKNENVLIELYTMLSELQSNKLVENIFDGIPVLTGDRKLTTSGQAGTTEAAKKKWPLMITQFSDSFVLSCPAENIGSCRLLLQTVYAVKRLFFWHLGILMRGGIAKGQLIHEQGGVLFGPAMNAAYALESKSAIYPRVLIADDAAKHLRDKLGIDDDPLLHPFFESFDGHTAIDIVSLLSLPQTDSQSTDQMKSKLDVMGADIQVHVPRALPKIRYLQDRLKL